MKLMDLLILMGVTKAEFRPGINKESTVIIMPEETDGFDVKDVIYFQRDKQMWLVVDEAGDKWLRMDDDDEDPEDIDIGDTEKELCEREGDMCALPEVSGDPKCLNPFCTDGKTEWGPCSRCNKIQEQKLDPCENPKHKARRA